MILLDFLSRRLWLAETNVNVLLCALARLSIIIICCLGAGAARSLAIAAHTHVVASQQHMLLLLVCKFVLDAQLVIRFCLLFESFLHISDFFVFPFLSLLFFFGLVLFATCDLVTANGISAYGHRTQIKTERKKNPHTIFSFVAILSWRNLLATSTRAKCRFICVSSWAQVLGYFMLNVKWFQSSTTTAIWPQW